MMQVGKNSTGRRRGAVVLAIWVAGLMLAGAEAPDSNHSSRYDLRVWQTDEGLPQNSVNAITQTDDGYLWVGTREGLARFDGVRFTMLDEPAAPYLKRAKPSRVPTHK